MVLSENIYFLLLFTLPAALNIIFNAHLRSVPQKENDKSVELAVSTVFCLAVFFCNLLFMQEDIRELGQYLLLPAEERPGFCTAYEFDYFNCLVKYFVVNLFSSISVIILWYSVGQWIFRKGKNIVNRKINRPDEMKFPDVWTNLFETKEIVDVENVAVRIEKGSNLVSAGLIRIYPTPEIGTREIALYNTDRVKEIFEEDKHKEVKDRIFPYADCEYYDFGTDTLIKFYSLENYDKMPENIVKEPE